MHTVWIVNDGGHDFSAATQYGELRSLTEGNINPFKVDRLAKRIATKLRAASVHDYLLISGAPILTGLAVFIWLERFGECNLLQFDAKGRDYHCLPVFKNHLAALAGEDLVRR